MEISEENSLIAEQIPSTSVGCLPAQSYDSAPMELSTTYSMLPHESYPNYSEQDPHISSSFGPLSIPLFTGPFNVSPFVEEIPLRVGTSSEEDHFDYDEQVAEELDDSDDDSPLAQFDSHLTPSSSTGALSDSTDPSSVYDGLFSPRRSNRERRLPTPFVIPVPKEIRT
jgi:hypothetical protein